MLPCAQLKILCQHSPGGTEENQVNAVRIVSQDWNWALLEYKSEVLPYSHGVQNTCIEYRIQKYQQQKIPIMHQVCKRNKYWTSKKEHRRHQEYVTH
jgi:hypothetical protein